MKNVKIKTTNVAYSQTEYATTMFKLLDKNLQNDGRYSYNICFIEKENNRFIVSINIDKDNKNNKQITLLNDEIIEQGQKQPIGMFYSAVIISRTLEQLNSEVAKKDFEKHCYLNLEKEFNNNLKDNQEELEELENE